MRLIDANALMEYLLEKLAMYDSVGAKMGLVPLTIRNDLQGFVETIKEQPTIDAVPVVHGYWRPHPLGYTSNLVKYEEWDVCSNCGIGTKRRNMTDDFFEEYSYSYCPWCGAKMDGKEKENG